MHRRISAAYMAVRAMLRNVVRHTAINALSRRPTVPRPPLVGAATADMLSETTKLCCCQARCCNEQQPHGTSYNIIDAAHETRTKMIVYVNQRSDVEQRMPKLGHYGCTSPALGKLRPWRGSWGGLGAADGRPAQMARAA
jgi:hypothetical protein